MRSQVLDGAGGAWMAEDVFEGCQGCLVPGGVHVPPVDSVYWSNSTSKFSGGVVSCVWTISTAHSCMNWFHASFAMSMSAKMS